MTVDPVARISAQEALVDPWLVGNQTDKAMDFKTTYDALDSLRDYQVTFRMNLIVLANSKVPPDHFQLHFDLAFQL